MKTLYEVLGVTRQTTDSELKRACHQAAVNWYLRRNQGSEDEVSVEFQCIIDAYSILADPLRRANYDANLRLAPSGGLRDSAHALEDNTYDARRGVRSDDRLQPAQWWAVTVVGLLCAAVVISGAFDDAPDWHGTAVRSSALTSLSAPGPRLGDAYSAQARH
jgi:curved DNA-binding protein CbpA